MLVNKHPKVAYFCMEYALDPSLRTYAGGLGILAGDYLKGAKDCGLPMVGIGIKWKQGYSRQMVDEEGRPYDAYPNYHYPFLKDTEVKVHVQIRGRDVACKVWLVDHFGNAPVYLLDTDLPENSDEDKWITGQLYGWFGEERIAQEMVLGIGGIRALRTLEIDADVYHFNEGHAVFAGFELIREKISHGMEYLQALQASREEIVFTTHTPVIQGNERHYLDRLIYMGANNGLSFEQMVELGGAPFNMTVAALRLARTANAVSQLHKETANKMWADVERRAPIIGITNAIHIPSWVDPAITEATESDDGLWEAHQKNKHSLIAFIKERTGVQLDPEIMLIGFSRRAAPYKRSSLIFSEWERITHWLEGGKFQLVFSGKAHPLDDTGKEIVSNLIRMAREYPKSVVFLKDYDMVIGRVLTCGADVWLNNPRRPMEASGTSGMKAAMNGGLNVSILDGWWPEACEHGINGWQFGDGFTSDDPEIQDAHDLKALYKVLEEDVIPVYYNDRTRWIKMMRNSILSVKERFGMRRMLEEYYERMYKYS